MIWDLSPSGCQWQIKVQYRDKSCLRLVRGKIQCMLFKFAQEVGVSNVDDDSHPGL